MKYISFSFLISLLFLAGCSSEPGKVNMQVAAAKQPIEKPAPKKQMASLSSILAKKEVPILCYHHIRNVRAGESENMKSYSVSPAAFAEQMKALSDSGYQTILP